MPAKIRLQRQGRKFQAIYSIVVADSRAPRDGKFIEELGQYNPNTNPATIVLDFNKALVWLQNGAQPTDTCRAILSYKGVLYKKHLLDGVKKGAFDEAEAEKRFQAWMTEKEQKVQGKKDRLKLSKEQLDQSRMEGESKIKEARAAEIAKKRSDLVKKEAAAASGEEVVEEVAEEVATEATEGTEAVAEVPAEEPKAEAVEEASATEVPAEEPPAEEPAEETPAEEPKAEAAEETPAEEPKAEAAEETPAEEPKAEAAEEPKTDEENRGEAELGEAEGQAKKED
jgi:small subunit ribosomal protein S16